VIIGPDGAAWVTDGGQNAIARVDPAIRDRHPIRAHSPPLAPRFDPARRLDRPAEPQQFLD
jgi:streptogramin lyase